MVQVRLSGSPSASAEDVDLARSLCFEHPAESGDSSDSRVFVATVSGSSKFVLKLDTAEVASLTRSRRHTYTLIAGVAEGAAAFLARMDQHVVRVVKANVRTWFEHSMNKNLVDEYYRRSSQHGEQGRPLGRFVLHSEAPPPESLEVGAPARLTLQMVGLQFRQQYFTCVWKLVSVKPLPAGHARMPAFAPGSGNDQDPDEEASVGQREQPDQYRFRDDQEDAPPLDDDQDEPVAPSAEELHTIRASLMAKLEELERSRQTRLDDARDMIATLVRSSDDLGVLADLDARLDDELAAA